MSWRGYQSKQWQEMVYYCKTKTEVLRSRAGDIWECTWLSSQTFLSPGRGASISVAPSRKWESGFTLNSAVLTLAGFKNRIKGLERTSKVFFQTFPCFAMALPEYFTKYILFAQRPKHSHPWSSSEASAVKTLLPGRVKCILCRSGFFLPQ